MSDFHVQTELLQQDLARMIRQTNGWVSKGVWQEVYMKTANHIYYDELDKIAQKQILGLNSTIKNQVTLSNAQSSRPCVVENAAVCSWPTHTGKPTWAAGTKPATAKLQRLND